MADAILVLDAGSSSLTFAVYEVGGTAGRPSRLVHGQVEGLRAKPRFQVFDADGRPLDDATLPDTGHPVTHDEAMGRVLTWLQAHRDGSQRLVPAGHRVVHGGAEFAAPVRIDAAVLARLDALGALAPLHQPPALHAIRALQARLPDLPQVACFDTAFHRTQPDVAQAYALPRALRTDAGRRPGAGQIRDRRCTRTGSRPEPAPAQESSAAHGALSGSRCSPNIAAAGMRILLTGATGLIGRELGEVLVARGDTLVCLVRDADAARCRLPFPAAWHAWDHTLQVPPAALDGVEAVIHLAGEPVAEGRWSSRKKALIRDSCALGTRQLVHAVMRHGGSVKVFVQGSASGYHGERGDERLSAASSKCSGFLPDVIEAWEAELRPLAQQRPDLRVPVVRTGIVLARQGGALAAMLPLFRLSLAGRLGQGRQWMSWIHLDDIVRLFVHALDTSVVGVLEGVAP